MAKFVRSSPLKDHLRTRFVSLNAQEALAVANRFAADGVGCTVHLRGDPATRPADAVDQVGQYATVADALGAADSMVDTEISVKMEQNGLFGRWPGVGAEESRQVR